jgi:hypothetical protein
MNVMKLIGVVLLSIVSIAVLVVMVLPVAVLILGLGIDIPNFWTGKVYLVALYPWVSLLAGLLVLVVFGWGIWKLTR